MLTRWTNPVNHTINELDGDAFGGAPWHPESMNGSTGRPPARPIGAAPPGRLHSRRQPAAGPVLAASDGFLLASMRGRDQ